MSTAREAWLIYAVLLARGLSYVLLDAGETAILPAALPARLLGDVNGWRTSAQEGMKLVAPLAGAGIYAWGGPVPVILMCAAMPILTATCYAFLQIAPARPADRTQDRSHQSPNSQSQSQSHSQSQSPSPSPEAGEIRAGLRALFDNPPVRVPVLIAAVAIGLSGLTNAPVLAQVVHGLHLPATSLGYLSTAQGAGSIVSGLLAGRLLTRFSPIKLAALGTALFAVGCASKAIPWWPATITGSAIVGLGLPWPLIAGVTAVQTGTPDHLLGRVSAISGTVMFAPVALAIPLGAATVHFGPANALLFAAALALAVALVSARGQGRPQDQEPRPAKQAAN